jgi:hypothetical protein
MSRIKKQSKKVPGAWAIAATLGLAAVAFIVEPAAPGDKATPSV